MENCNNDLSLLTNAQFSLVFDEIVTATMTLQRCAIPSLTLPPANVSSPFVNLKEPGDHIEFENFTTTFKLTENFKGYLEVFNWMTALGFPESGEQYKNLVGAKGERKKAISNARLSVYTNSYVPNIEVAFYNIHPVFLSNIPLETALSTPQPIDVTATFTYDYFSIKTV